MASPKRSWHHSDTVEASWGIGWVVIAIGVLEAIEQAGLEQAWLGPIAAGLISVALLVLRRFATDTRP